MKKYVQWWEVKEYLYNLVDRLKKDQYFHLDECPGIFTFPRGGLMLATLLSYEIDKPILMNPQPGCIIIDDIILSNIANKIDSNIRELEGVFNKIVARASLTHSPITIELAEKIINEFKYENEKVISCDFIKETIAKYFSISKDDLSSNKRSNDIAFPRQIAMFLCREIANMSYPQIGEDFGGRDHSTVMHACRKIEKEVKEKTNTKLIVDSVKNIIVNDKKQ